MIVFGCGGVRIGGSCSTVRRRRYRRKGIVGSPMCQEVLNDGLPVMIPEKSGIIPESLAVIVPR
jgi:hypothetical protein